MAISPCSVWFLHWFLNGCCTRRLTFGACADIDWCRIRQPSTRCGIIAIFSRIHSGRQMSPNRAFLACLFPVSLSLVMILTAKVRGKTQDTTQGGKFVEFLLSYVNVYVYVYVCFLAIWAISWNFLPSPGAPANHLTHQYSNWCWVMKIAKWVQQSCANTCKKTEKLEFVCDNSQWNHWESSKATLLSFTKQYYR